jgi:hypothetical protein
MAKSLNLVPLVGIKNGYFSEQYPILVWRVTYRLFYMSLLILTDFFYIFVYHLVYYGYKTESGVERYPLHR